MYNNYETQPMAQKAEYGNGIQEHIRQLHDAVTLNQELISVLDHKTSVIRLDVPVNPTTDTPQPSLCEIALQIFSATQALQQNNRAIAYILDTLRL
jgi:hypothetical protein